MEDENPIDDDDNFFDEFPFYDCPEISKSSSLSSDNYEVGSEKSLNFELAESKSENDVVSSVYEDNKGDSQNSTITIEERTLQSTHEREIDDGQFSLLGFLAQLLVKSIGFQFNLLINLLSFPFSALYYGLMIFINPYYVIGLSRSLIIGKLMKIVYNRLSPLLFNWIKGNKSWLNLVLRFVRGLFWCFYVCVVLMSLLVLAFVIGGFMMRFYVVEKPFEFKQPLNFDYTKSMPQAYVPITSCASVECGVSVGSSARVISVNQKLQATVTMVLPESDYNRNLEIFQVYSFTG